MKERAWKIYIYSNEASYKEYKGETCKNNDNVKRWQKNGKPPGIDRITP